MANRDTFHEDFSTRDEARTSSDRTFGFVFTVVFTVIGLWPAVAGNAIRGGRLRLRLYSSLPHS